jgi:hypothetical protein
MEVSDYGLDLSNLTGWNPQEYETFRQHFAAAGGGLALPGFDFWAEVDPLALKRLRLQVRMTSEKDDYPLPALLSWLHYYAIVGYDRGIQFLIESLQRFGCKKEAAEATLAIAYIHGGPRSSHVFAVSIQDQLRTYTAAGECAWPPGWAVDDEAFVSGVDFGVPLAQAGEIELITRWYQSTCSEVPEFITFLGQYRPNLLKAIRGRFESAIRGRMPKQMMPYLMLNWNTARCNPDGIRHAALLGRAFGMKKSQLLDSMCDALVYGGPDVLSAAARSTTDIIASMES